MIRVRLTSSNISLNKSVETDEGELLRMKAQA